jgi:hypothetical protein
MATRMKLRSQKASSASKEGSEIMNHETTQMEVTKDIENGGETEKGADIQAMLLSMMKVFEERLDNMTKKFQENDSVMKELQEKCDKMENKREISRVKTDLEYRINQNIEFLEDESKMISESAQGQSQALTEMVQGYRLDSNKKTSSLCAAT